MAASPHEAEMRQFGVLIDGTVRGDDGESGRLAASLRYAARLAGQVEFLLDVGDLVELATVSREAITVRVTHDEEREMSLSVRVDTQPFRQPKVLTVVGGADVHAALAHCIQRVRSTPGVAWTAIIADDRRVVGASLPQAGAAVSRLWSSVPNVGVRVLAVLGAIEEPLRESWVQLSFERATVLVAAVGPHCVYAVVDEVRPGPFGEALDEVRAILAPYDLSRAATLATETVEQVVEEEPVAAVSGPALSGMRYRVAKPSKPSKPRTPREGRRGLFGR